MNLNFEREIIGKLKQIAKEKLLNKQSADEPAEIVHEESLEVLRGLKIAIDANILLALLVQDSNPRKFIQEGGCSLDIGI